MNNKAALNYDQTAEEILKYKEFDEHRLNSMGTCLRQIGRKRI